jgi:hypothetical protein
MSNNKPENVNRVNNYFIDYYFNQLKARFETVKNPKETVYINLSGYINISNILKFFFWKNTKIF